LAGFIEAKGDGTRDNWSYKLCKAPVKSSPPTNQHPVISLLKEYVMLCHVMRHFSL